MDFDHSPHDLVTLTPIVIEPQADNNVTVKSEAAEDILTCNNGYRHMTSLRDHERTVHEQYLDTRRRKSIIYHCYVCSKTFKKPSQLERHRRIHTGERPFICDICSKAFNQKNALVVHTKKHTGDKPYLCHHCSQAFIQKCNLNAHIQRYHGDQAESTSIIPITSIPSASCLTSVPSSLVSGQSLPPAGMSGVQHSIVLDINDLNQLASAGIQIAGQSPTGIQIAGQCPTGIQMAEEASSGIQLNKKIVMKRLQKEMKFLPY